MCHEIRNTHGQSHNHHADEDTAPCPAHSRLPGNVGFRWDGHFPAKDGINIPG
jgi:hypothetical protein